MNNKNEFKNAKDFFIKNSHSAFNIIDRKEFEMFYNVECIDSKFKCKELHVQIRFNGKKIGSAHFTDNSNLAFSQNVEVNPKFRREGLATAMYVFAEKFLG